MKHLLLLGLLLVLALAPAVVQASSITVRAGTVEGSSGAEVAVPIDIQRAQKLGALQMDLFYDPAVLEPQPESVEQGSFAQEATLGSRVITPGVLRLVMNGSERAAVDGDGTLMRALFTVKGQTGQSCALQVGNIKAWDNLKPDSTPQEMLVTVEHGKFTVAAGFKKWILWAAGAFLALLLLIFLFKGKRPAPATAGTGLARSCGQCGAPHAPDAKFCPSCGKPL